MPSTFRPSVGRIGEGCTGGLVGSRPESGENSLLCPPDIGWPSISSTPIPTSKKTNAGPGLRRRSEPGAARLFRNLELEELRLASGPLAPGDATLYQDNVGCSVAPRASCGWCRRRLLLPFFVFFDRVLDR